jgi:hypothetical protein
MKAFTSSGGCALFLETVMRIHGEGAVKRMIRRAREEAGKVSVHSSEPSLIHCCCDHRHNERMVEDIAYARKTKAAVKKNENLDTTPRGDDCFSIELLSLLLTGRVHSTLHGWSAGPLGFGLLTDKPCEVSRGLSRPEKPVWILKGPTCYSVLWLEGSNDHAESFPASTVTVKSQL